MENMHEEYQRLFFSLPTGAKFIIKSKENVWGKGKRASEA